MLRELFVVRVGHLVLIGVLALANALAWVALGEVSWWTLAPVAAIAAVQLATWALHEARVRRTTRELEWAAEAASHHVALMTQTSLEMISQAIRTAHGDDPYDE